MCNTINENHIHNKSDTDLYSLHERTQNIKEINLQPFTYYLNNVSKIVNDNGFKYCCKKIVDVNKYLIPIISFQ